jgi:hypothetical protein
MCTYQYCFKLYDFLQGHPVSIHVLHPGISTIMVDWDVCIIHHVLYLQYNNNLCHYSTVYQCPLFLCINSYISQNSFSVVSISTGCTNKCVCLLMLRHSFLLNILHFEEYVYSDTLIYNVLKHCPSKDRELHIQSNNFTPKDLNFNNIVVASKNLASVC